MLFRIIALSALLGALSLFAFAESPSAPSNDVPGGARTADTSAKSGKAARPKPSPSASPKPNRS